MKYADNTIAIVDDNQLYRKLLRILLTDTGYHIAFDAENGQECVYKLRQAEWVPAVFIVDIEMPLMDGFETTLFVKQNFGLSKIIANSSLNDNSSIDKMIANGADVFVDKSKMMVKEILLNTIDGVLAGHTIQQ